MSIQRLVIDGYGQVELNNCAFPRDGRVEAQAPLSSDLTQYENGMILTVDKVANKVCPYTSGDPIFGLVYSAEHLYDERAKGLKNFVMKPGDYPRVGLLSLGDKFTTNTICYDDGTFADDAAVKAALAANTTTPVYGVIDATGAIKLVTSKPGSGFLLRVVKVYTMPDGQFGVRFQVVREG